MPPAPAAVAAQGQGQGQGQQQQPNFIAGILRMVFMWWMMRNFFGGQQQQSKLDRSDLVFPKLQKGDQLDMWLYVSEKEIFSSFKDIKANSELVWQEASIPLATNKDRTYTYTYHPSEAVQHNASVYAHVFFTRTGFTPDPEDAYFDQVASFHKSTPLNIYLPERKNQTGVKLLSGGKFNVTEADKPREWVSYIRPNLTIAFIDEFNKHPAKNIPPPLREQMVLDPANMEYYPPIWFNYFWELQDWYVPVNETLSAVEIKMTLTHNAGWWFMILNQMEQSFEMQRNFGAMGDGESDEVKRIFLEGNPYFLGVTMFVSMLHSIFDILAFKNDIGFWKDKKNVEGLSVRTILINAFCQIVIFLYLLDNKTSFVVLASSFVGTIIEFWKITKAMDVSIDRTGRFPKLVFKDKQSYSNSETKEHDRQAMVYLSYVLYPLVIGYAIYSLVYESHKSWYSWILSSLVGAVYAFGFILMCPQLYLNYKLQSVAHLPWRQMTYKFLNTIIDDLFAFVIKMPLMHRLSVFRDDIVFLVYLYQRWIYRVDKTRANEFGYAPEPVEEPSADAGAAPAQLVAGTGTVIEEVAEGSTDAGDASLRQRKGRSAAADTPEAEGEAAGAKKDK